MALLYALFCSWAVVLRKFAARKHNRLKKVYDKCNTAFQMLEQECKSHEVAIGRPADYHLQMQLLRLFESKESARQNWVTAGNKWKARKQRERKLRKFNGRKLPYTFGLFDMAILFKAIDFGQRFGNWDFSDLVQLIQSWV